MVHSFTEPFINAALMFRTTAAALCLLFHSYKNNTLKSLEFILQLKLKTYHQITVFLFEIHGMKKTLKDSKWYIINDFIKKVYKKRNLKIFTGENRKFHMLRTNTNIYFIYF